MEKKTKDFKNFYEEAKKDWISSKKLAKAKKILSKMPVFNSILDDAVLVVSMIKDYGRGTYKKVPFRIVISFVVVVLYLVFPEDAIPDFIPFVGYVDDLALFEFFIRMFSKELEEYKKFKEGEYDDT